MTKKQTLFKSVLNSMGKSVDSMTPLPGQRLRLSGKRLAIPLPAQPVQIEFGEDRLYIQKEVRCDESSASNLPDLVVFNPDFDSDQINYSMRIKPGQAFYLDRDQPYQEHLFTKPGEVFRRKFRLDYEGGNLVFRDPVSEPGTHITLLEVEAEQSLMVDRRKGNTDKIIEMYGGPFEEMQPTAAISTLRQVNDLLRHEAFRAKGSNGTAGGLLELPENLTPVVVGDLHANIDNLLKILSENAFIRALEKKTGVLVFLGDLVQPDSEPYDDMGTSVVMMDVLLKLKLWFPEGVFYLRGNHDSFSTEVSKNLVPQGVLWRKKLEQIRGKEYCEQMSLFYDLSPVVVLSGDFVACHAGPPSKKIDPRQLVNLKDFPDLLHELTWTRIRRPGYPSGYSASDVRRFRKSLNLGKDFPFLVGHTPYTDRGTLWCDVAGIPGHHILYSANSEEFGIFMKINGKMVPQILSGEPLLGWTNERAKQLLHS